MQPSQVVPGERVPIDQPCVLRKLRCKGDDAADAMEGVQLGERGPIDAAVQTPRYCQRQHQYALVVFFNRGFDIGGCLFRVFQTRNQPIFMSAVGLTWVCAFFRFAAWRGFVLHGFGSPGGYVWHVRYPVSASIYHHHKAA